MEYKNSYFIAITGHMGSGKTTVAEILREKGFDAIDVDCFSKELINKDNNVKRKLCSLINNKAVYNNQVDFKYIGKYFDENFDIEKQFEKWYQPYLGLKIKEKFLSRKNSKLLFFDIPLLEEKNIVDLFDEIWLIETAKMLSLQRIKIRNNYKEEKIKRLLEESIVKIAIEDKPYQRLSNNVSKEDLVTLVENKLKTIEKNFTSI